VAQTGRYSMATSSRDVKNGTEKQTDESRRKFPCRSKYMIIIDRNQAPTAPVVSVLFYLAAIGKPNLAVKLRTLQNNLYHLAQQNDVGQIDLVVNIYSDHQRIHEEVLAVQQRIPRLNSVSFHNSSGILAELWSTNPFHSLIYNGNYACVLFVLDDVQLLHLPINRCLEVMNTHRLDILSPRVSNATWTELMADFPKGSPEVRSLGVSKWNGVSADFAQEQRKFHKQANYGSKSNLKFVNHCEWYCYVMRPKIFVQLLQKHSAQNRYCWGVDLLLGYFGFKSAVWAGAHCHHLFKETGNHQRHLEQMYQFLQHHGFRDMRDVFQKFPQIVG